METRKVQLSGGTTYTVSLPKSWATEQRITSGSVLYLHPDDDGTLLVEAGERRETDGRTVELDVSNYAPETLAHAVASAYLGGVDELVLVDRGGHDDETIDAAMDLTANLSGFEVIETGERRLVFQNIIDPSSVSIRKTVLRLKLVALAMHRDAVRAVTEADVGLARQVVSRDAEADKLFSLVTRQFQRALDDLQTVEKLDLSRPELFEYYHTARQFERIGDHAAKMAYLVTDRSEDLAEVDVDEFARLARESRRIVERAADVVLTDADATTAFDVIDDATALEEATTELDEDLYGHEDAVAAYVVGLLLESVRRTAGYGRNVAEMGLRRTIRRGE
ncbi:PhoU domain-containing protein [Halomarina pelagica]|uniref:PhoU domain-containing protein n=1 Tax=Halomarina pelagica TaxID=2961599 RepID=UPI0020C37E2D|nr:PhoU domain-containing protein [Halomarina sp. BND7]